MSVPVFTGNIIKPGDLLTLALFKGVPEYLVINGILSRLLIGGDDQPLQGADGEYLYGDA